jgi:phosphoenolpyruvate carboxykinase (GTP)
MSTTNETLAKWVEEVKALTQPDKVVWCDGSQEEYDRLMGEMVESGMMIKLNEKTYPNCYLHRSDPNDVARTEHLTFVCTKEEKAAGPNNNWKKPEDAHKEIDGLFEGCMKGRTMYVIPYCMGPIDAPSSRCGVEISDSPYVVVNMNIMTRMGTPALKRIEKEGSFVKGLHSTGDLTIENRRIMHFPEELAIKSIGSGYGGNALLGKKCHALRIASYQAQTEGWLAEHMLIVGIENPEGVRKYVAAAFPSACGKTNLAMMIPPESRNGWKIWTVGDDIAWLSPGKDGKLWAINPEAGYFGVAPGTSEKTNPNALRMLNRDAIFTNVAVTEDMEPWWEGKGDGKTPATDWQGRDYDPANGPAAHPNSRFTVSAKNCASYAKEAEDATGVPIDAIIFGGRRPSLVPLVYEATNWDHGVLVGASVGSETTAAQTGAVGVLRRDPMAMKPFCGYNFADYFSHWLSFTEKAENLPKIFHVNWFRQDDGKFLWPGFGENIRVLEWILKRCTGEVDAKRTPIGMVPLEKDLNRDGLNVEDNTLQRLLEVDTEGFKKEMSTVGEFLDSFGDRSPERLKTQYKRIVSDLNA